jgi:hypothetical protein
MILAITLIESTFDQQRFQVQILDLAPDIIVADQVLPAHMIVLWLGMVTYQQLRDLRAQSYKGGTMLAFTWSNIAIYQRHHQYYD